MRIKKPMKIHNITVEGIGDFAFKHRTMRTSALVMAEYEKITGGVDKPSGILQTIATWLSVLKVLTVKSPDNWDIEEMDPLEPDSYTKLNEVYSALVGAEERFRSRTGDKGEGTGPQASGDDKAMVQTKVSASS